MISPGWFAKQPSLQHRHLPCCTSGRRARLRRQVSHLEGPLHTAPALKHQVHPAPFLTQLLCNGRGLGSQVLIQRKDQVFHLQATEKGCASLKKALPLHWFASWLTPSEQLLQSCVFRKPQAMLFHGSYMVKRRDQQQDKATQASCLSCSEHNT